MIWISTEKSMKRGCCHHLQLFFRRYVCMYVCCIPPACLDRDVCPACSPHECPASMSGGSQKSLWTRAPVSSIWVDSPADPSKLFYKHATILTERCLVWRGYKKGLKRSHVHLPLSKPAAGRGRASSSSVHVSPIDPSFFPVQLVSSLSRAITTGHAITKLIHE